MLVAGLEALADENGVLGHPVDEVPQPVGWAGGREGKPQYGENERREKYGNNDHNDFENHVQMKI